MKQLLIISTFGLIFIGFVGCNSVPRHFVREEVVIYYYEPILVDCPPIEGPIPPETPTQPIIRPGVTKPNPIRDQQSGNNIGSYNQRDPLQDGGHRNGEIKSDPPVRKPVHNDRD